jgi:hypothetical protein
MNPTYERHEWIHDHEDEPPFIYSELGDEQYETRKIVLVYSLAIHQRRSSIRP